MSIFKDIWSFLVLRKLWPVAILLIAAAVAVPKLLAEEPAPPVTEAAVAVKGDKNAVLATEPIVAPAADADRSGRRQVLGSRKDPFKPQVTPTPIPVVKPVAPVDAAKAPVRQGWRNLRGRLARADHRHTGGPDAREAQEDLRAQRADRALRPER